MSKCSWNSVMAREMVDLSTVSNAVSISERLNACGYSIIALNINRRTAVGLMPLPTNFSSSSFMLQSPNSLQEIASHILQILRKPRAIARACSRRLPRRGQYSINIAKAESNRKSLFSKIAKARPIFHKYNAFNIIQILRKPRAIARACSRRLPRRGQYSTNIAKENLRRKERDINYDYYVY